MRQLLRRAWYLIRQRQLDADVIEEMKFHREMKHRELEASGLETENAALATRRALGSTALAQDQSRDVWCPRWLQGLGLDLRLAIRTLLATPIVTTVAVLSLTLGMGANTAIFSLVNSLLLRALPVADPERLVTLSTGPAVTDQTFSYATFDQVREHGQVFDGALAVSGSNLSIAGDLQPLSSEWVSGDFFATLGVPALLGRTITLADDVEGGGPDGPVAMISYALWQRRFGGAAGIIGTSLVIERLPVAIVGILPPEFLGVELGRAVDLALPIRIVPLIRPTAPFDPDISWLSIMLRLRPGQSREAAAEALRAVQPAIRAGSMPRTFGVVDFLKGPFALQPALAETSALRQRFERPLVTILFVVVLVLLIACANIANLQLARCTARRQELSVRLALGASRWRLARLFLMEAMVLSALGAALGFVCAAWVSRVLVAQLSTAETPLVLDLSVDWRVLAFTGVTMVATTVLFGMAPVLRARRVAPMDALKDRGRGAGDSQARMTNGLIVAQIAISLMLVVAAGLFVRTFARLTRVSLGFDRDRVLVVTVSAPTIPAADRNPAYHRLVRAAAAAPGVAAAGGSINPPLIGRLEGDLVVTTPGVQPRADAESISQSSTITPGWLAAYGTPIREGRDIDDRDTRTTQPVMLVNEAFVRRFFPGRSPISTTLAVSARLGALGDVSVGTKTVVGVVADAAYRSVREPARPALYFPLAQFEAPLRYTYFYIAARSSSGSPALLTRSVAAALTAVNPDLRLTFSSLAEQVNESLAQDRLLATLSGLFGALALLLAGLGLYGVTAYAVARRRAEIGIRMALGSTPAAVVRLVLARVSMLVGIGVIVGVGLSLWASQFVATLLYGLEPRDPATLVGAAFVLATVAAFAGWLPAWGASRIDPAVVLRNE